MLKAIEYEILRGVKASGLTKIPLARQPVRVATMMDEEAFRRDQFMIHNRTVFLEDKARLGLARRRVSLLHPCGREG